MSFLQKPVQLMDGASRVLHGVSTSVGTRRLLGQVAANDGTDPQALLRLIDALKTREKIDSNKRAVFSRLRDSLSQDVLEFAMLTFCSKSSFKAEALIVSIADRGEAETKEKKSAVKAT